MTKLEMELRELLIKYDMNIADISILFNNFGRNALLIRFDEMKEGLNEGTNRQFNCKLDSDKRI